MGGGGVLLSLSRSLSLYLSLSQSRLNLWTFSILLFFPCSFFIATSLSVRLSRCISADLNEDSQHFSLPANTLSKRKSRSGKSIFFHIIKSSSGAVACVVPSARSPSEGLNPREPQTYTQGDLIPLTATPGLKEIGGQRAEAEKQQQQQERIEGKDEDNRR